MDLIGIESSRPWVSHLAETLLFLGSKLTYFSKILLGDIVGNMLHNSSIHKEKRSDNRVCILAGGDCQNFIINGCNMLGTTILQIIVQTWIVVDRPLLWFMWTGVGGFFFFFFWNGGVGIKNKIHMNWTRSSPCR